MRSFAFSSIQDQRAELERGGRGGEEPSVAPLSRLHPCYTVSDRLALQPWRLQTDTQRCFVCFISCTVSSSRPPPSSHIWFGFFLVCFCHSLGFGFVWFLFGLCLFLVSSLKKKAKTTKKCDTCSLLTTACPSIPFFVVVKDQSRINKEPPPPFPSWVSWTGRVEGITAEGSGGFFQCYPPVLSSPRPPHLHLCLCIVFMCLGCGSYRKAQPWKNALVSIWELMAVWGGKWNDWWGDDGNRQISVNMSRHTGVRTSTLIDEAGTRASCD